MNGTEHVLDLLGAYALDALDDAEAARVRAHLADCPACRAELAGLAEAAGRLVDVYPAQPPPPALRSRVLAAVESAARAAQPAGARPAARPQARPPAVTRAGALPWRRWAAAAAALALVASQVWLIATVNSLRAQLALQGEAQTILLSSNETPVNLRPPDPSLPARGVYHYEPDLRRGLIIVYHLALPAGNHDYACWLEFASGPAQSCGRLALDSQGAGMLLFGWSSAAPIRVRITLETGAAAAPSGPTILLGSVPPPAP